MTDQWFTLISVLSGAVVGGLINYLATSKAKSREWHLSLIRERILERQKLYADFLAASQLLIAQSLDKKISNVGEIGVISNELARIELVASQAVVDSAKSICDCVLSHHAEQPDGKSTGYYNLKIAFIGAVRTELEALERPNNSFKGKPLRGSP